ncbi:hypothetical protein [Pseudomonas syringae]|uniref:hypothetical protein n=1 Tax=Pseudomonas syringae TaxID=317 RepID=UPI000A67A573|nr:hypothetical protein [Pseudomonas syringae]
MFHIVSIGALDHIAELKPKYPINWNPIQVLDPSVTNTGVEQVHHESDIRGTNTLYTGPGGRQIMVEYGPGNAFIGNAQATLRGFAS